MFRIYRLKENPRQQFRWAPHLAGAAQVKRKDYEEDGQVDASSEYAAWTALRDTETPLRVGDILETDGGELKICKYVGFDAATWILPELKTGLETAPVAAPVAAGPASQETVQ